MRDAVQAKRLGEEESYPMSIASAVFQWWRPAARVSKISHEVERFPTHSRVVLPDGQIMLVRMASLAAAKDLLAAQRAAERRIGAQRETHLMGEVMRVVDGAGSMRDSVR